MEFLQCSCGYAGATAGFAEHLGEVFVPANDIGTDGQVHAEMSADRVRGAGEHPGSLRVPGFTCSCGFVTEEPAAFDEHLLAMFITPDQIGTDGTWHAVTGNAEPLVLCPCCCTIDDIPEWTPSDSQVNRCRKFRCLVFVPPWLWDEWYERKNRFSTAVSHPVKSTSRPTSSIHALRATAALQ